MTKFQKTNNLITITDRRTTTVTNWEVYGPAVWNDIHHGASSYSWNYPARIGYMNNKTRSFLQSYFSTAPPFEEVDVNRLYPISPLWSGIPDYPLTWQTGSRRVSAHRSGFFVNLWLLYQHGYDPTHSQIRSVDEYVRAQLKRGCHFWTGETAIPAASFKPLPATDMHTQKWMVGEDRGSQAGFVDDIYGSVLPTGIGFYSEADPVCDIAHLEVDNIILCSLLFRITPAMYHAVMLTEAKALYMLMGANLFQGRDLARMLRALALGWNAFHTNGMDLGHWSTHLVPAWLDNIEKRNVDFNGRKACVLYPEWASHSHNNMRCGNVWMHAQLWEAMRIALSTDWNDDIKERIEFQMDVCENFIIDQCGKKNDHGFYDDFSPEFDRGWGGTPDSPTESNNFEGGVGRRFLAPTLKSMLDFWHTLNMTSEDNPRIESVQRKLEHIMRPEFNDWGSYGDSERDKMKYLLEACNLINYHE